MKTALRGCSALFLLVAMSQFAIAGFGTTGACIMVRRQSTGPMNQRYGCVVNCLACSLLIDGTGPGTHTIECSCIGNSAACRTTIKFDSDEAGNVSNVLEGCTQNTCTGPCDKSPATWSGETVCRCDGA